MNPIIVSVNISLLTFTELHVNMCMPASNTEVCVCRPQHKGMCMLASTQRYVYAGLNTEVCVCWVCKVSHLPGNINLHSVYVCVGGSVRGWELCGGCEFDKYNIGRD